MGLMIDDCLLNIENIEPRLNTLNNVNGGHPIMSLSRRKMNKRCNGGRCYLLTLFGTDYADDTVALDRIYMILRIFNEGRWYLAAFL